MTAFCGDGTVPGRLELCKSKGANPLNPLHGCSLTVPLYLLRLRLNVFAIYDIMLENS